MSPAEPACRPCRSCRPWRAWSPWLVWLPAALLFTYAFFHRVAPSVMIDPLMRDLGVGAAFPVLAIFLIAGLRAAFLVRETRASLSS